MTDPKAIIGEAGVKALADAGFTITPPKAPEPPRLVTMEESRKRFIRFMTRDPFPLLEERAILNWDDKGTLVQESENAADNWLVRTVNERIIEGLIPGEVSGHKWVHTADMRVAYRPDLLRIFAGEGT